MRRATALLALFAFAVCGAHARIHDLVISGDPRAVFSIETFGFFDGGHFVFELSSFKVRPGAARLPASFTTVASGLAPQSAVDTAGRVPPWLGRRRRTPTVARMA